MKNLTRVMVSFAMLTLLACTTEMKEDENLLSEQELNDLVDDYKELFLVEDYTMSKKELESFQKEGFAGEYVRIFNSRDTRTGEVSKVYEIGKDVYIKENDLFRHSKIDKGDTKLNFETGNDLISHYRTTNLVTVNNGVRTIEIKAINFFYFQNMDHVAEGLIQAVENYNNLNLGIQFDLNFYTIRTLQESWPLYTPGINAVIHNGSGSNVPGGIAVFPSSGNPGSEIRINAATNNESINVNEHVVTHEIGHCLGMRHTDFFNRAISCGSGGNEGNAGVGAIHIPGTPAQVNIDVNSVFLSCFSLYTNGEFSNTDILALNALY
ncbi:M57 family metalloprotease [Flagellimonas iocasae]|uniref:M57 family metalloprotease n=1 Tax=Flagellimonas iocasae TaxID=2055905 RepID=A0ABW4XW21_9FLAO